MQQVMQEAIHVIDAHKVLVQPFLAHQRVSIDLEGVRQLGHGDGEQRAAQRQIIHHLLFVVGVGDVLGGVLLDGVDDGGEELLTAMDGFLQVGDFLELIVALFDEHLQEGESHVSAGSWVPALSGPDSG